MDQVGMDDPAPIEEEDEDDGSENAEAGKKPFLSFSSKLNSSTNSIYLLPSFKSKDIEY